MRKSNSQIYRIFPCTVGLVRKNPVQIFQINSFTASLKHVNDFLRCTGITVSQAWTEWPNWPDKQTQRSVSWKTSIEQSKLSPHIQFLLCSNMPPQLHMFQRIDARETCRRFLKALLRRLHLYYQKIYMWRKNFVAQARFWKKAPNQ